MRPPRIPRLQVARRTVQLLVVVLTLLVPAAARYNNYLSARELDKALEKWEGTAQGAALRTINSALRALPGGEVERGDRIVRDRDQVLRYARSVRGGPWSLEIGPMSLTDPLAAAESLAARKRSSRALWIGLMVPVAIALVLGRVFCSWVCPMGYFLELTDKLRRPLRWLELQPRDIVVSRGTKYVLLGVGLLMASLLSLPLLGYVYPPAIVGRELHDLVFGFFDRAEVGRFGVSMSGLTWMSLILVGIALIEVTVSRRWWCRYVCPGGALYSLLGWLRPVRVRLRTDRCTTCGNCNKACHLGLQPMQNRMGPECDSCGLCISSCADDALGYGTGFGALRVDRIRTTLLVLFLGVTLATVVQGHHILGTPHYSYDERYPQVPILTYRVDAGPHEVEMTGYPGLPKPGERCFLNVYVRKTSDGTTFDGVVRCEVLRDRLIGTDPVVYGPVEAHLEDAVYKFYPRFDEEAGYTLRIQFEAQGVPWIIDLPMVIGEPGSPWAVVGSVLGGLIAFVVLIRAVRIKKLRHRHRERAAAHPVSGPEPLTATGVAAERSAS